MDKEECSTDGSVAERSNTEEMKRIFTRTKKIQRTPTKVQKLEEDKLDLIVYMMKDIITDQKEMRKEVQQTREEQRGLYEEIKKLREENQIIKNENNQIKEENEKIKKELIDMEIILERIEKEKKKNNIIIKGLEIEEEEPEKTKELINCFVKLREKMYLVELHKEDDKRQIMQNIKKLKKMKTMKIFIDEFCHVLSLRLDV